MSAAQRGLYALLLLTLLAGCATTKSVEQAPPRNALFPSAGFELEKCFVDLQWPFNPLDPPTLVPHLDPDSVKKEVFSTISQWIPDRGSNSVAATFKLRGHRDTAQPTWGLAVVVGLEVSLGEVRYRAIGRGEASVSEDMFSLSTIDGWQIAYRRALKDALSKLAVEEGIPAKIGS